MVTTEEIKLVIRRFFPETSLMFVLILGYKGPFIPRSWSGTKYISDVIL